MDHTAAKKAVFPSTLELAYLNELIAIRHFCNMGVMEVAVAELRRQVGQQFPSVHDLEGFSGKSIFGISI